MNVLIMCTGVIPAKKYGGSERIVWGLGKELVRLGHRVKFMAYGGSSCPFAAVLPLALDAPLEAQIPIETDVVHFHFPPWSPVSKPHVVTIHGNANDSSPFSNNAVFVSRDHAERHTSRQFVYNGYDWDDLTKPDWSMARTSYHYLGKAAWRKKNVSGAITIARRAGVGLNVMGGYRLNFSMGFRFTPWPRIKFWGMVGGGLKHRLLNTSKGLIFPVRWHEPFGLSMIESLFYGCPVFGTPYGSLPELILPEVGFLSHRVSELAHAVRNTDLYSAEACHDYAREMFNARKMAAAYLEKYEVVLNGRQLNPRPPRLRQLQKPKFLPFDKR